jgi:putative membrane protein
MMGGGYGYGGGYYGYGLLHMAGWIVILVAVVVAVIWLVRSAGMCGMAHHHHRGLPPGRSPGLDVLEERYARGEINRDEYLQKKRDITA